MTVLAAEAVPAAESAAAAEAPAAASAASTAGPAAESGGSKAANAAGGFGGGGQKSKAASTAPAPVYHRIIIAEFAVAVLIAGASPLLKPGGPFRKAPLAGAGSGSLTGPLIRLTAVCAVFFILALAGTGERSGKIAAAFGGLVVLGMAFNALPEITTLGLALGGPRKGKGGSSTNPEVPPDGTGGGGRAGEGGP